MTQITQAQMDFVKLYVQLDTTHEAWQDADGVAEALDALIAIGEKIAAGTHALVPIEPTVEMLVEGTETWLCEAAMEDRALACYRAMIAAVTWKKTNQSPDGIALTTALHPEDKPAKGDLDEKSLIHGEYDDETGLIKWHDNE